VDERSPGAELKERKTFIGVEEVRIDRPFKRCQMQGAPKLRSGGVLPVRWSDETRGNAAGGAFSTACYERYE